jgi:very-short-patch-repair endonuclease/predicted transcriptional regulator of viral defense system
MPGARNKAGRVTGNYVPFNGQPRVVELAERQHGSFSLPQLLELGYTASAVRKRCSAGHLHRIYRGVYALVPRKLLSVKGRCMAAILACGEGALLSHRSAADLLDLRATQRARIDVTVPNRTTHKHLGIDLHRSTTLSPEHDITEVDGIPCTSVSRTIADLAAVTRLRDVEKTLDQAQVLEVFDLASLTDQTTRHPSKPGTRRLKRALARHDPNGAPPESEFERRAEALLRGARLPPHRRQFWIQPSDGGPAVRADFAWPERKVILEADGRKVHGTRRAFESDRLRDQRLAADGWRIIRVTWWQLLHDRAGIIDRLTRLLRLESATRPQPPNEPTTSDAGATPARRQPQTQPAFGSTASGWPPAPSP